MLKVRIKGLTRICERLAREPIAARRLRWREETEQDLANWMREIKQAPNGRRVHELRSLGKCRTYNRVNKFLTSQAHEPEQDFVFGEEASEK